MKFRNGILSGLLALLLVFSPFTAPLTSRAQTSSGQGAVAPGRKAEFVPGNVLVRFRTGGLNAQPTGLTMVTQQAQSVVREMGYLSDANAELNAL